MSAGLLGIEDLERGEVEAILARAKEFQRLGSQTRKRLDILNGRMVVNLFYEASTRTRTSFEIAAKRLGADAVSITAAGQAFRRGKPGGHAEHAGGDAAGCHRHAARGFRCSALSRQAFAHADRQRRRRNA